MKEKFLSKRKWVIHILSSSVSFFVCPGPFSLIDETYYTEEASKKRKPWRQRESYRPESYFEFSHTFLSDLSCLHMALSPTGTVRSQQKSFPNLVSHVRKKKSHQLSPSPVLRQWLTHSKELTSARWVAKQTIGPRLSILGIRYAHPIPQSLPSLYTFNSTCSVFSLVRKACS